MAPIKQNGGKLTALRFPAEKQLAVFQCTIKADLNRRTQFMDFIDEEDIPGFKHHEQSLHLAGIGDILSEFGMAVRADIPG